MSEQAHAHPRWTPLGVAEGRAPRAWPRFMTARVAADYCDTSPWTIRRHVRPCGRRGRTFIFSIESVEEWMRGQGASHTREEASSRRRSIVVRRREERDVAKADRVAAIAREKDVAA